ncbi:hypothetical protein DPMN_157284 [Dreissena polymorpha]|uniref:Uncharacterized protein n=1 Tax=Dreissena polymorpha TaxID=45954 RepID=A0A9D4IKX9_DREPO|nr:hypothetical protein DPMN_157284 [Dreissena polymorpha]
MPCSKKLKDLYNSKGGKRVRFTAFLLLNLASVASDWWLYYNVSAAEEGLVFGPPGNIFIYLMLAFTIIGSFAVVPKGIMDWREIIGSEEHECLKKALLTDKEEETQNNDAHRTLILLDTDIPLDKEAEKPKYDVHRTLILLYTDISLLIINLNIVQCREQAISYFQIWKSNISIASATIRLTISWWIMSKLRKEKKPWMDLFYKNCCVYIQIFLAILLLYETQIDKNEDGTFEAKVPHNILKGEYDDRRYFTNVSIYFSHPYLEYETNISRENINFIRLLSIYDLQHSNTDRRVNIKYDITHKNFLIQTDGQFEECFTKMNGTLIKQAVCSDKVRSPAGHVTFMFHFVEQSPPQLIFGDITYNMRAGKDTSCEAPDFQVVDNMDDHIADPNSAMMRYYRNNPNINEEYHMIKMSNDTYQFYRESDLINIEQIWRRYWGTKCKSTGSPSPHMDERLGVQCL